MAKHVHAALIKEWTEDTARPVQWRDPRVTTCAWRDLTGTPAWTEELEYRFKPAEPKWPASTMTDEQLALPRFPRIDDVRAVVDAALAHAYESGAAIPKAEHEAAMVRQGEHLRLVAESMRMAEAMMLRWPA